MSPRFITVSDIREGDTIVWFSKNMDRLVYSKMISVEEYEAYDEPNVLCHGIAYTIEGVKQFSPPTQPELKNKWRFPLNYPNNILLIARENNQ